jgi:hypothetical protein
VPLSEAERERRLDALRRHAAAGALDAAELERRVELVLRAEALAEAEAALDGLPPLDPALPPGPPGGSGRPRLGRGHGEADAPASDWQATGERFRDPRTGAVMRVWVDGAGRRHYVAER